MDDLRKTDDNLILSEHQDAERILVVDDEPEVAKVLSRALTYAGYSVDTVNGAEQALELLGKNEFALLLSDIHMPGMHGDELQRIAREHDPDLAVILITAAGDVACAVECMREGVFDYIIKPAPLADVVVRVGKGLERRRMTIELRAYQTTLVERVGQQAERIRRMMLKSLQTLTNALEAKDENTRNHSVRVAELATALAKRLRPDDTELHARIRLAGVIHDIGKIGIPEAILSKPGRLDPKEYAVIQKHPVIGEAILRPLLEGDEDILAVVRHHHERWDGRGYPDGLAGERTPLAARITAVADGFDAMRHARAYRQGMPLRKVLDILKEGAGSQWDAGVVQALLAMAADGSLETATEREAQKTTPQENSSAANPKGPVPAESHVAQLAKRGPAVPVRGVLDSAAGEKLRAKIDLLLSRGNRSFVLDFAEVDLEPSGAEFVHALAAQMRQQGVHMVVRNAGPQALEVLAQASGSGALVFERSHGRRPVHDSEGLPKAA